MRARSWYFGAIVGLLTGFLVSVSMTFADWRLNPSGIFHNEQGTDWAIVTETALSWFWPVALVSVVATAFIHAWISSVRAR